MSVSQVVKEEEEAEMAPATAFLSTHVALSTT